MSGSIIGQWTDDVSCWYTSIYYIKFKREHTWNKIASTFRRKYKRNSAPKIISEKIDIANKGTNESRNRSVRIKISD